MQAEKQQSWKIYIHAKAKNFHFKLKVRATNIVPTWEFHRCSVVLKLGKCLLKLKSNCETALIPSKKQPKTLKSKFLALLKKFRFRRSKNRTIGFKQKSDLSNPEDNRMGWFAYKEPICLGSLFAGILAFLAQSISNKDQRAIVIHGSVISLYLGLLFKKYMTGRISNFLVLLVACSLVLELDTYLRFDYIQMAWDYLVSSGLPGIFKLLSILWGPVRQSN
ncbi:uncharacterized protein LOC132162513 [Corylus avellana]|uniref:uncharacterized protein LOC132162513 n=1 Tax=Corylus avellana TaxID=13451 RepID=UPI00286C1690|nr:uncharacterized protein LOC132162513 [Corylus avellana]